MAEDWAINVRKYAPDADDAVIASIVKYCGIALRNRDSSLVSFGDAKETARVRENYCRKKLGLADSDADLDAMIARVNDRMSDDPTRNRVTVYYLLAHESGKLGLFGGAATAAATAAAAGAAIPSTPSAHAGNGGDVDHKAAFAPASRPAAAARFGAEDASGGSGGFALAVLGGLGAIIIGTATAGSLLTTRGGSAPAGAMPVGTLSPSLIQSSAAAVAAPAAAAVVTPAGAGVTAQQVEGKPLVSVYFDTAKTAIAPDFATVAAPIKAWIDAHPGDRLAVSGFNDPSGNAAFNAELSKNRAKAVAAALAGIGVPADRVDLVKPADTTDATIDKAQARRVDIAVKADG